MTHGDTEHFVQIRRGRGKHFVYLHTYEPATGRHIARALVGGFPCSGADDSAARIALRVAAQRAVRAVQAGGDAVKPGAVRDALRRVLCR